MNTREFEVVYISTVREVYYVEAESEEEARQAWSDDEPLSSEAIAGAVESVREIGEGWQA